MYKVKAASVALTFGPSGLSAQPSPEMLRSLFEQALERSSAEYDEAHAGTAQAVRDLGLFW